MEITSGPLLYGMAPNRKVMGRAYSARAQTGLKQGIITRPVTIDELFAPRTCGLVGVT